MSQEQVDAIQYHLPPGDESDDEIEGELVDDAADALVQDGATSGPTDPMVWNPISAPNVRDIADPRLGGEVAATTRVSLNIEPRLLNTTSVDRFDAELACFVQFLPVRWITDVMLDAMNVQAEASLDLGAPFTFNGLLTFLGTLMYAAAFPMETFRSLWNTTPKYVFREHRHVLHRYISREKCERFRRHFGCLRPEALDRQHPIKGVLIAVDAFNRHWASSFVPGWAVCMDESTMIINSRHNSAQVSEAFIESFAFSAPNMLPCVWVIGVSPGKAPQTL